ncbi:MAG: hypothetical protein HC897_04760 [Thermoanaerobaculia bacterium]|nr:hypothetical protein [Thermoanaerobaculia bacterium]
MHKRFLNHARLRIELIPRGPILVKSGIESPDPTRPAMAFVRTRHAELGETVYLPGTSLKGLLRSHAERLLAGLGLTVHDPFQRAQGQGRGDAPEVFRNLCPVERTFGSLACGGRLNVTDAYPWMPEGESSEEMAAARDLANQTEVRLQVGIDRQTGSTQDSTLFDLEVVNRGSFHAEIYLENFQLWQLGLIEAVLRDVDDGFAPVGFGKSRGLGQMSVTRRRLDLEMIGKRDQLAGAGALVTEAVAKQYDLTLTDLAPLPPGLELESTWRGRRLEVAEDKLAKVLEVAVEMLERFVAERLARTSAAAAGR